MANGRKMGWYPANADEEEKAAAGEPYQGLDGKFYRHENMPAATPKNPPAPVAPAAAAVPQPAPPPSSQPSAADLDAVAAEEAVKQATAPPAKLPPTVTGGLAPDFDTDKFDSTGKSVKDGSPIAPRGADKPPDVMTDAERAAVVRKQEAKLAKGMPNTSMVDSIGKRKGAFKVIPQGLDRNGARIPDKVDYSQPVEVHNPVHGPRGKGAPKDTFHQG
jgi:hypothetical protein